MWARRPLRGSLGSSSWPKSSNGTRVAHKAETVAQAYPNKHFITWCVFGAPGSCRADRGANARYGAPEILTRETAEDPPQADRRPLPPPPVGCSGHPTGLSSSFGRHDGVRFAL